VRWEAEPGQVGKGFGVNGRPVLRSRGDSKANGRHGQELVNSNKRQRVLKGVKHGIPNYKEVIAVPPEIAIKRGGRKEKGGYQQRKTPWVQGGREYPRTTVGR